MFICLKFLNLCGAVFHCYSAPENFVYENLKTSSKFLKFGMEIARVSFFLGWNNIIYSVPTKVSMEIPRGELM